MTKTPNHRRNLTIDAAQKGGLWPVVKAIAYHDSRPDGYCLHVAKSQVPSSRFVHVQHDGHALRPGDFTVYESHVRDPDLHAASSVPEAMAIAADLLGLSRVYPYEPDWVSDARKARITEYAALRAAAEARAAHRPAYVAQIDWRSLEAQMDTLELGDAERMWYGLGMGDDL